MPDLQGKVASPNPAVVCPFQMKERDQGRYYCKWKHRVSLVMQISTGKPFFVACIGEDCENWQAHKRNSELLQKATEEITRLKAILAEAKLKTE